MHPREPGVPAGPLPDEAIEFVRFCYLRRRTGWPELYDEMVAVASRRLYRGLDLAELGDRGIGLSLFETARLALLVARIEDEEEPGGTCGAPRSGGDATGVVRAKRARATGDVPSRVRRVLGSASAG